MKKFAQKLLCLSHSDDVAKILPPSWLDGTQLTHVENPIQVLRLLKSEDFDGVFVCPDAFKEVVGLSELVRDSEILKNLPEAVALLDADQKILWCNRQCSQWFETQPDRSDRLIDYFQGARFEGGDQDPIHTAASLKRQTTTKISADGPKHYDLLVSPIIDANGSVSQLIAIIRDITTETLQKQKLEAIHLAGVELANLTPEEIFQMDVQQRIEILKSNILHYTQHVLNYDVFEIRLVDDKTGLLEAILSVGIDSERAQQPLYASPDGNGVTGFVVATGRSYICEDTAKDPLYLDGLIGARSCLAVPLIVHDHVIGSINVESPETSAFDKSDMQFLEIFSRDVAAALNTLELLAAQGANSAQKSVEAIHSAVALPIDEILNETVQVIEKYIGHDGEVVDRLKCILRKARDVKQMIQRVGAKMAPAEAVPEGLLGPAGPDLSDRRILVIDSDDAVRDSAHKLLEKCGCIVETAHHGEEALAMIRTCDSDHHYDGIISDIRLEDMTGYDLMVAMSGLKGCNDPALILMTGFGYDPGHTIVKARKAGLQHNAILYKPFRSDQLLETVEKIIKQRDDAKKADANASNSDAEPEMDSPDDPESSLKKSPL